MSTVLCIDTASERFALAVDRDGQVESFESSTERAHTVSLLPSIARLLGEDELAGILVVTGPGAYAGLRVGLATAQGLAIARDVPIAGVPTLEAVAQAAALGGRFNAVHPAGRGEFAVQGFDGVEPIDVPRALPPEAVELPAAGELASALGGTEISPRERCLAALRAFSERIRSGGLSGGVEAFYLREPNITISRRLTPAT